MKNFDSMGLRHSDGKLWALDQQLLPDREEWIWCQNPDQMIQAIRALKVRGAPLIGVAAAASLAKYTEEGHGADKILEAARALRAARPTAVNLMVAIDRLVPHAADPARLVREAETIFDEDVALCERMGTHGAALVKSGESILTHCNAGGLATVGIGTAVGVIRKAHDLGKKIHVYVDETRPLLQGGRLTAWELEKAGIPYTLICDNMAAYLMAQGKIQRAFVGSDRIALNGDFANKIGTYSLAVNARYHGVPLHPVAPYTTIDFKCETGAGIPIEERDAEEVKGAVGSFGKVRWAPARAKTYNPSFDVTPVALLESMVLDRGVYSRADLQGGALKRLRSELGFN